MRKFKPVVPILIAAIVLTTIFILPVGVGASEMIIGADPSTDTSIDLSGIGAQTVVLSGTDVALSGTGGRLPEVAANDTFAAVVYEQSGSVYLRSVKASAGEWKPRRRVASSAYAPKLAFRPGSTNTVHVAWVGGTDQSIRHAACTLADDAAPTCGSVSDIATAAANLGQVDITVDGTNGVHVAWFDGNSNQIKTAYSTNATAATPDWNAGATIDTGGSDAGQPVLAAAGNYVHLAFKDYDDPDWAIQYRRLTKGAHTPDQPASWGTLLGSVESYKEMGHPAIAAVGSDPNVRVYLTWDNQHATEGDVYGLVGVENTKSGVSTLWEMAMHITSTRLATTTGVFTDDYKYSYEVGVPQTEEGLRPSLAVTDTNKFAVVWQAHPDSRCNYLPEPPIPPGTQPTNGTSEVFFASPYNSWTTDGTLANMRSEYSIDPDIAVDNNGTHIVFMKADDAGNCYGGGQGGYKIYYRGPFTSVDDGGGVYLPVILKNSSG